MSDPALMRYTAEPVEVSLVDNPCLPEATFAVLKADGSTELRKFKRAASGTRATLGKIGARHSKADKERIRKIHDLVAALDPDCCAGAHVPGAHVEPSPGFPPLAGEHGDAFDGDDDARDFEKAMERPLAKALAGVVARIDTLAARLKKIEDQPMPLGTSSVRVAEKTEDSAFAAPGRLLDQPGALEALAEAAIRKAQANPMRAVPGFKPHGQ
jgi:hypothetical protein